MPTLSHVTPLEADRARFTRGARRRFWVLLACSGLTFLASAYLFLCAAASASMRFWHCGPTSLDAPEPYCRAGAEFLVASYATVGISIALLVLAMWFRRRNRHYAP